jgi:SHS family lactate transporter-like MFS transporter
VDIFFPKLNIEIYNVLSLAGGDNLRTTILKNGVPTNVPNYGAVCYLPLITPKKKTHHLKPSHHQVQGILVGVVAAFVVFITIIGPEHHGSHFEKSKTAFEQGGGEADPDALVEDDESPRIGSPLVDVKEEIREKE